MKTWLQILLSVVIGLLGAGLLLLVNSAPRGEPVTLNPPPTAQPIEVHVSGAVPQPGVYKLPPDSRVTDAIEAAGGLLPDAFSETLNLAGKLADGDKLLIPFVPTPVPTGMPTPTEPVINFPININTASAEELQALPNIGPSRAQDIITHRQTQGAFTTIEQIQNVYGIGPATFEQIKGLITIE